jgi:hypothetical protein
MPAPTVMVLEFVQGWHTLQALYSMHAGSELGLLHPGEACAKMISKRLPQHSSNQHTAELQA